MTLNKSHLISADSNLIPESVFVKDIWTHTYPTTATIINISEPPNFIGGNTVILGGMGKEWDLWQWSYQFITYISTLPNSQIPSYLLSVLNQVMYIPYLFSSNSP
jgi:hypothetical protein